MACAGVTLAAVATNRSMAVSGTVRAEGELDVRGTLGHGPRRCRWASATSACYFDLQTDAGDREVADLVATTEKYCVVLQTLLGPVSVAVTAHATTAGPGAQSQAQT